MTIKERLEKILLISYNAIFNIIDEQLFSVVKNTLKYAKSMAKKYPDFYEEEFIDFWAKTLSEKVLFARNLHYNNLFVLYENLTQKIFIINLIFQSFGADINLEIQNLDVEKIMNEKISTFIESKYGDEKVSMIATNIDKAQEILKLDGLCMDLQKENLINNTIKHGYGKSFENLGDSTDKKNYGTFRKYLSVMDFIPNNKKRNLFVNDIPFPKVDYWYNLDFQKKIIEYIFIVEKKFNLECKFDKNLITRSERKNKEYFDYLNF